MACYVGFNKLNGDLVFYNSIRLLTKFKITFHLQRLVDNDNISIFVA